MMRLVFVDRIAKLEIIGFKFEREKSPNYFQLIIISITSSKDKI